MGRFWILLVIGGLPLTVSADPVRIIFDTDMDSDCDDAGALSMLHALADAGEAEILATTVSARHPWSGPCVDAINTYFGRPNLPIGVPKATPNTQGSPYARGVAEAFPHDFPQLDGAPDAVAVYREVLAAQPDGSVTIVTVGDVTNIRDLLRSGGDSASPLTGVALAQQKVKRWVCMGSRYPADDDPNPWGNFKMDPGATVAAVRDWPGEIIFTGGGDFARSMPAGAGLVNVPEDNPVRRAYALYFGGKVEDRHTADLIAVMVAVRGSGRPWQLERRGYNEIFDNGTHAWRVAPDNPMQSYVSALAEGSVAADVKMEMEALMMHLPAD